MERQILSAPQAYVISIEESERIRILKVWLTVMVVFIHSYAEEISYAAGALTLQVPPWLNWTKYLLSQVVARCAVPGFSFCQRCCCTGKILPGPGIFVRRPKR